MGSSAGTQDGGGLSPFGPGVGGGGWGPCGGQAEKDPKRPEALPWVLLGFEPKGGDGALALAFSV